MVTDVKSTRLDAALRLARQGFRIFPLQPNSKVPAIQNWRTLANVDEGLIRQWWAQDFPNANIGLVTDGYCVIDVDPRNGGEGSWDALMLAEDIPDTLTAQTQSGGTHMLFTLPAGMTIPNSKGRLGPGIDIKAIGGYIVAAGSEIDGRPYKWFPGFGAGEIEAAPAPQWLLDQARAPIQRTAAAGKRVAEEDDEAVQLATDYLWKHAPSAEEGKRDNTAFAVAAKFFDYGVSETHAWQMLHAWNDARCTPPLDDEDIDRIIDSAQRNRSRAIGSASPNAPGFEAVEIAPRAHKSALNPDKHSNTTLWEHGPWTDKAITSSGDPLIEGVLDRGTMSVLYGESGSGKTFVALDMAAHINTGTPWNDKSCRQGAVVYVAAEGGRAIYKRLAAQEMKNPGWKHFYLVRLDLDLVHDQKHVKLLYEVCKQTAAHAGLPVEMIVVDTLSRALAGGDENSPVDMGALVKNLDALRSATGAHVKVVHHSGKNKARGARGHSLLRAATDTELEVNNHVVTATKQRDLDTDFEMAFKLPPITIGEKEGKRITSCTVEWRTVTEATAEPAPLSPFLARLKRAIQAALPEGKVEFTWADIEGKLPPEFIGNGKGTDSHRRTFAEHRSELVSGGHCKEMPGKRWLLISPEGPDSGDDEDRQ